MVVVQEESGAALEQLVEVVVETEAEAGASGYSVTGGGTRGIFIKDVLKDSPAAKIGRASCRERVSSPV